MRAGLRKGDALENQRAALLRQNCVEVLRLRVLPIHLQCSLQVSNGNQIRVQERNHN